jgi:hypothetical protein
VKKIDLLHQSNETADLLNQARKGDLVVRLADGSELMLVAIGDFDLELARTRANPNLMKLLDERAKQTQPVPLDEVKRRLGV